MLANCIMYPKSIRKMAWKVEHNLNKNFLYFPPNLHDYLEGDEESQCSRSSSFGYPTRYITNNIICRCLWENVCSCSPIRIICTLSTIMPARLHFIPKRYPNPKKCHIGNASLAKINGFFKIFWITKMIYLFLYHLKIGAC